LSCSALPNGGSLARLGHERLEAAGPLLLAERERRPPDACVATIPRALDEAPSVKQGPINAVRCEKGAEAGRIAAADSVPAISAEYPLAMSRALQFLVLTVVGWVNRHQEDLIDYLREENRVLRELLGPQPLRLTDAQRLRLAVRGKQLGRRALMQVAGVVTPDTILRWYRRLIAQKYDGSPRRRRGRPVTLRAIADIVVRMAGENPQWGYTRIQGALANLGHEVARNTVKRILQDHGIDPASERSQRTPWKTFLRAHWAGLAAADFFTVEVLTLAGLKRYLVFFVIKTRRVQIAGIHTQPGGARVEQMARTLTDPVDGFLRTAR
jgi:transposase